MHSTDAPVEGGMCDLEAICLQEKWKEEDDDTDIQAMTPSNMSRKEKEPQHSSSATCNYQIKYMRRKLK